MARKTTTQKDAFERLRGDPVTPSQARESQAMMKEADAVWQKLSAQIAEALRAENPLLAMEVEDLIRLQATHTYGTNINGWVNPYPSDDPRSLLTQYQFMSHHDESPNVCDIWSRQTGKGFTVGVLIGERSYKKRKNAWTITSPSERQSLMTLDKCRDAVEAFGLMIDGDETERDGSHPQSLITSKKLTLSNRSVIRGVPGLPATLRGDTANLVIDEGDHVENATDFMRAVFAIVANEMAGAKQVRYITTPLGKNAPSWKYFHDPEWSSRRFNIWQAVLMGIKQNPARLLKLYADDPEGWAQEFLCEWIDSSEVLLPYEKIQSCESAEASEHDTPAMLDESPLRKVAGIDFGRVSDPTVMITALHGMGMNIVRNITKLTGVSTPDQLDILHPYMKLCDRVCVDYTGPGIGFGDLAVKEFGRWDPKAHSFGKIELCTFTPNLKRDIFPSLRLAFDKRDIRVPISTWFREDLHSMAQIINNAKYSYKAPRTDAGHSDGCTALALLVRAAASATGPTESQSIPKGDRERSLFGSPFDRLGRISGLG